MSAHIATKKDALQENGSNLDMETITENNDTPLYSHTRTPRKNNTINDSSNSQLVSGNSTVSACTNLSMSEDDHNYNLDSNYPTSSSIELPIFTATSTNESPSPITKIKIWPNNSAGAFMFEHNLNTKCQLGHRRISALARGTVAQKHHRAEHRSACEFELIQLRTPQSQFSNHDCVCK